MQWIFTFRTATLRGMILLLLLFSTHIARAQYACATEDGLQSKDFDPYENYSDCDIDLSSIPHKSIRLVFHIFQKDDGSGNIPNNSTGELWLYNMWSQSSTTFGNLQQMTSPTPSPYIKDSKIKVQAVGYHFWKNSKMWAKGNNTSQNGNDLYNFIMSQNFPGKTNSIHILIPGNYTSDGLGIAGIASGIGDVRWSLLEDVFNTYTSGGYWEQGANLRHELGHNMGLFHTFSNDRCDDTPVTPYQQYGYDNNVMAYNPHINAMTQDQTTRAHRSLQSNSDILFSGTSTSELQGTVSSSGTSTPLGNDNRVGGASATASITSPTSPITWSYNSGSTSYNVYNSGHYLTFSNLGNTVLIANWIDNCMEFSSSHVFWKGYTYSAGPNPATQTVTIKESADQNFSIFEKSQQSGITNIDVYDDGNNLVKSERINNEKSVTIDISALGSGALYFVVKGHHGDPVIIKVLKK